VVSFIYDFHAVEVFSESFCFRFVFDLPECNVDGVSVGVFYLCEVWELLLVVQ
jgi:hypothetical protein